MASGDFLAAARLALEKNDLPAALRHIASALGEDPNLAEALAVLREILAAAPDPQQLLPADDLPLSSSLEAVHAYILAEEGQIPEAIHQLLEVIAARPDVLYIDWLLGWLQRPEAAGGLDMEKLAGLVISMIEQFPALTAPHGGGRETLSRMPLFLQMVRRTQPPEPAFLMAGTALLCRLGLLDEALKLAREAHTLEPGLPTASTLAAAHATRNELDQALQLYREALEKEPGSLAVRLSMADLLVNRGQLQEARDLYAEVLEQEPEQEIALPSYYFLCFAAGEGEEWRDKLICLAEEQPENERAQRLALQVTPFVGYLPDPPDVTPYLQPAGEGEKTRLTLPYILAPSNYLAFDWLGKMETTVVRVPSPDPRLPRGPVDCLLWRYDGTGPRVAVAPPAPAVAQAVAELAFQPYRLDVWWGQARRLAQQLKPQQAEDLLATMVYPPGVGQVDKPALWVYHVQVAAALVLAHLDGGWEDSVRRRTLFSLANGPMDWTVDAALVALAALAQEEEDSAEEIAGLFRRLAKNLPADGSFSYYPALLWNWLRLPGLTNQERADLKDKLRRCRDARAAANHFRRAQAHVGKGELERAIEELTAMVQLDPNSAEAYRERGALALRQGQAQVAVNDFTQALQLQPGQASAHLGRGQACLKLGRFEQAIADFTESSRLAPWDWQPWYRRGLAHAARKEHARAVADFTEALHLAPEQTEIYLQRAFAYTQLGRLDQAIADYTAQIRLQPQSALAYNFRGRLHHRRGNHAAALADHLRASELDAGNANTHGQLAWIWATSPDPAIRNGQRALASAQKGCELTGWKKAHLLDALAAAQAECGRFDEAVHWANKAVELALEGEKDGYRARLETYRRGETWREK